MSRRFTEQLLVCFDGLIVIATGLGAVILHPDLNIAKATPGYPTVIALCGFLYVLIAQKVDLHSYRSIAQVYVASRRILLVLLFIFSLLIVLAFALKVSVEFSRIWAFTWFGTMFVGLVLNRFLLRTVATSTVSKQRVAVLGAGIQGQELLAQLNLPHTQQFEIVGLFDDRVERTGSMVAGYKVLGTSADLLLFASSNQCDRVLVALPWFAADRITAILGKLRTLSIDVSLAPDLVALKFPIRYSDELGFPLFSLYSRPLSELETLFKRTFDTVLAILGVVLLMPVFVAIAIAIKLDSKGPVFFIQRRYGFNRQPLMIYKFRTMKSECQDNHAEVLVKRSDDRITRMGKFLRKTSLDELPQLFNVIGGGMSIVGPRPHATKAKAGDTLYQDAVADYAMRYRVKPGITGWAQVNGWRGETDTTEKLRKRVEHDLHYIENWSPLLDITIIFRTVWVCVSGHNAY